jgi:DNA-binding NarL/FixJ family response regulator
MLEPQGYRVQVAEGLGQELPNLAITLARSFRPHVAIVDLRLLDEYRDERSGLGLLHSLQPARCILYSAYLKPEVTREALKEYGAYDCIGKSEKPERLMYAIAEAALESCAGRRGLSVRLPSAWTHKKIVQTFFGDETDIPPDIVEDVIGQLFPDNREVVLETMEGEVASSISAYQRRSIVLKVYPDDLEPKVIKLAPVKRVRSEARNYQEYIRDRLIGSFYAQLERSAEFWDLGGSVYTFLGSSLKNLPSFSAFYRREKDPEMILRPLKHFFKEVWRRHYEERKRPENQSLFQIYDRSFRLKERLESFTNQEEKRAFPGLPGAHTNPVPWVLRHSDSSFIPEARVAITHGDVHGDNLFVDGEHAWAIDFERTGPGHVLRDFVELEVDILTRLATTNSQDLSGFYELAVALAAPTDPSTACQPTASLSTKAEARKALYVISGIRCMAKEASRCRDSREYYWGLLLESQHCYSGPSSVTVLATGGPSGLKKRGTS